MTRSKFHQQFMKKRFRELLLSGGMVLLTLGLGDSAVNIYGQKTHEKARKTVSTVKPNIKIETETAAPVKTPVPSRIEIKTGDNPPLLTLVVGQVTTIKLHEDPLQIEGDRLGLNITESNENSINKNVYLIPTKAGIRRNLVIETASGKVEFELQSIAVEAGQPATFTREVEVKNTAEERKQKGLETENAALKESLANKEKEIAAGSDRVAGAVHGAEKRELGIQAEILLNLAKEKKGRTAASQNKEWEVAELFSSKFANGSRQMGIFEITYKGKLAGKFLEVKSEAGSNIFWQPGGASKAVSADGLILKKGDRLKVAVVEFVNQSASRGLIFVADGEVVKF